MRVEGFRTKRPLQHGDCEKVSSCNDSQFGFHKARALSVDARTRSNAKGAPASAAAVLAAATLPLLAPPCGIRPALAVDVPTSSRTRAALTPPCSPCTIFTMLHNFTLAHGVVHQHGDAARGTRRFGGSCTTCRRVCGDATRCTGCTAPFSSTIADRANAVRLYDGLVLRRPGPRAAVARPAAVRVRRFPPRAWCARRLEPGALTARTC